MSDIARDHLERMRSLKESLSRIIDDLEHAEIEWGNPQTPTSGDSRGSGATLASERSAHEQATHSGPETATVHVAGYNPGPDCGSCHRCVNAGRPFPIMALCPDCGNKRCPKAADHRKWKCTGSNEPGQVGEPGMDPCRPSPESEDA